MPARLEVRETLNQAARVNHTVFLCNAVPIPSPCSPLNETIIPSHCLWRTPALVAALYTPKSPPAGQSKGLASLFKKNTKLLLITAFFALISAPLNLTHVALNSLCLPPGHIVDRINNIQAGEQLHYYHSIIRSFLLAAHSEERATFTSSIFFHKKCHSFRKSFSY